MCLFFALTTLLHHASDELRTFSPSPFHHIQLGYICDTYTVPASGNKPVSRRCLIIADVLYNCQISLF